jgi:hypothetical protein
MAKMIQNVLFIVEGKTEGYAQAYGKGLQNILRAECEYMRQKGIRHRTLRKNGKHDLLCNVGFDIRLHLEPSKKGLPANAYPDNLRARKGIVKTSFPRRRESRKGGWAWQNSSLSTSWQADETARYISA